MKKKIFILLTAVCLTEVLPAQESKIPEFLHFSVDFAPALGNCVGQEDGPPYCGGGFWIHPKIGFDIWKSEKVSGVFETGIFFSYLGSVNMPCSVVDERSGTGAVLTFLMDKHVPSVNFSIGHRFDFLQNRELFFGIYGLFGLCLGGFRYAAFGKQKYRNRFFKKRQSDRRNGRRSCSCSCGRFRLPL